MICLGVNLLVVVVMEIEGNVVMLWFILVMVVKIFVIGEYVCMVLLN